MPEYHLPTVTTSSTDYHALSPTTSKHQSTTTAQDSFRHTLPVEVIEHIIKWLGWLCEDPFSK